MHRESSLEISDFFSIPRVAATVHQPADLPSLSSPTLSQQADLLEFRLDSLSPSLDALPPLLNKLPLPAIITARHPDEGGHGCLDATRRASLIRSFLPHAFAVDLELRSLPDFSPALVDEIKSSRALLILSFHDFDKTPSQGELIRKIDEAVAANADIIKIATLIRDDADLDTLASLLAKKPPVPLSLMGMGERGGESRLLLARRGSVLNYGYLNQPNAPGQLPAAELKAAIAENTNTP